MTQQGPGGVQAHLAADDGRGRVPQRVRVPVRDELVLARLTSFGLGLLRGRPVGGSNGVFDGAPVGVRIVPVAGELLGFWRAAVLLRGGCTRVLRLARLTALRWAWASSGAKQ